MHFHLGMMPGLTSKCRLVVWWKLRAIASLKVAVLGLCAEYLAMWPQLSWVSGAAAARGQRQGGVVTDHQWAAGGTFSNMGTGDVTGNVGQSVNSDPGTFYIIQTEHRTSFICRREGSSVGSAVWVWVSSGLITARAGLLLAAAAVLRIILRWLTFCLDEWFIASEVVR